MITLSHFFLNEADYLQEWVEFHLLQGVERFYLFDHGSTDHWRDVLDSYICRKIVSVKPTEMKDGCLECYREAVDECKTKWLGMCDVDEFIFPVHESDTISGVLERYQDVAGVGVPWVMYTSNNRDTKPLGLVTESYRMRVAPGSFRPHIKPILRPERVTNEWVDTHFCRPKEPWSWVNDAGGPLTCAFPGPMDFEPTLLRMNHYWCKSRQEWGNKIAKGIVDGNPPRQWCHFDGYNASPQIEDYSIGRYVSRLKEAMRIA